MNKLAGALSVLMMLSSCDSDHERELSDAALPGAEARQDAGGPTDTGRPSVPATNRDATVDGSSSLDAGTGIGMDARVEPGPKLDADVHTEGERTSDGALQDAALQSDSAPELADAGAVSDASPPPDAAQDTTGDGGLPARSDMELTVAVSARLQEGQLVGAGTFVRRPVEDAYDRCVADCILGATCSALIATECTAAPDLDFQLCQVFCTQAPVADGFPCLGAAIPHALVCDTFSDCADKSDEVDCGTFACADGTVLASERLRCNGRPNCQDGSDESGCASYCATVL